MSEPMLNDAMRRNPNWNVEVYDPAGCGATGTTARGFLAEYDEAIREAMSQAYDQGRLDEIHAQATGEYRANPYAGEA